MENTYLHEFQKRDRLPMLQDLSDEQLEQLTERQKQNITHIERVERRCPGLAGKEGRTYWVTLIWILGKKHPLRWKKPVSKKYRTSRTMCEADHGTWVTVFAPIDEVDGSIPIEANPYYNS